MKAAHRRTHAAGHLFSLPRKPVPQEVTFVLPFLWSAIARGADSSSFNRPASKRTIPVSWVFTNCRHKFDNSRGRLRHFRSRSLDCADGYRGRGYRGRTVAIFRDRRLHALRHREGMGESWRSYRRGYGRRFIFGADFASPQVFASARVPGQPAPPTLIQLLQF